MEQSIHTVQVCGSDGLVNLEVEDRFRMTMQPDFARRLVFTLMEQADRAENGPAGYEDGPLDGPLDSPFDSAGGLT